MVKDNIQENLVSTGRKLIKEKGADFLTARKLSEASGYSVGTIYNQFGNMDNFILIQNYLTLDSLYQKFKNINEKSPYQRLNLYVSTFVDFVIKNKNFWFLVFNFHLKVSNRQFSLTYLRRISTMISLLEQAFKELYPKIKFSDRQVSLSVLWITMFALSSLLTTNSLNTYSKIDYEKMCLVLLDTYLTGLKVLEKI